MKGLAANIGWTLIGLLVIAGTLLTVGKKEYATSPEPASYFPSGTHALQELLTKRGYVVSVDRSAIPLLKPGDTALAFEFGDREVDKETATSLDDSLKQGATIFYLPVSSDFVSDSQVATQTTEVTGIGGAKYRVNTGEQPTVSWDEDYDWTTLVSTKDEALAGVSAEGKGFQVSYMEAIGLSNRFIDRGDNARVFLQTLSAFAKPGSRVVFTTASFVPGEKPGLLEMIGPWAQAAWYQVLFLVAVVGWTLNRRFGLPEPARVVQRGSKELLDAISDTFQRSRSTSSALIASWNIADRRIRATLKLPRDAGDGERNRLLPETLANSLNIAKVASKDPKTPPKEALKIILELQTELDAFLGPRTQIRIRKRKF